MKLSSRFNWYSEQKVFPYLEGVQEGFSRQREYCPDLKNRREWTEDLLGSVARAGRAILTAALTLVQQLQVSQLSISNF